MKAFRFGWGLISYILGFLINITPFRFMLGSHIMLLLSLSFGSFISHTRHARDRNIYEQHDCNRCDKSETPRDS